MDTGCRCEEFPLTRSAFLKKKPDHDLGVSISIGSSNDRILFPGYPAAPDVIVVDASGNSATGGEWVATGIHVERGDLLKVEASGEAWYLQGDDLTKSGPEGHPYTCQSLPSSLRCGALIAKIGNDDPFGVGRSYAEPAKTSGELMLAYQDLDNVNNYGEYNVTIEVGK